MNSLLLVVLQLLIIFYIASTGPVVPYVGTVWHGLFLGGLLLGAWAIWTMRVTNWSVTPAVLSGATLVTDGPYRFVRHPMYASLLLIVGSMVGNSPSPDRWVAFLGLVAVLVYKLTVEEALLRKAFKGYKSYMGRTKRLLPFLY